ncbi:hypothetical protein D3C77_617970 [compost metagenome]
MQFQHAVRLVDQQRGEHHEGRARHAAHQTAAGQQAVEQAHAQGSTAPDHQRLAPGARPGGHPQGNQCQHPDDEQHEPIGLPVKVRQ